MEDITARLKQVAFDKMLEMERTAASSFRKSASFLGQVQIKSIVHNITLESGERKFTVSANLRQTWFFVA